MAWAQLLFFSALLLQHGRAVHDSPPDRRHVSVESYGTSAHAASTNAYSVSGTSGGYSTLHSSDGYQPYHPSGSHSVPVLSGSMTLSGASMTLSGSKISSEHGIMATPATHSSSLAHTGKPSSTGSSAISQIVSHNPSIGLSSVPPAPVTPSGSLTVSVTVSSSATESTIWIPIAVPPPGIRTSSTDSNKPSQPLKSSTPASSDHSASTSSNVIVSSSGSLISTYKTTGATTQTSSVLHSSSGTVSKPHSSNGTASSIHLSTVTASVHTASTAGTTSKSVSVSISSAPLTNGTTTGIPVVVPPRSTSLSHSFSNSSVTSLGRSTSLSPTALPITGQSSSRNSTGAVPSSTRGQSDVRTSTGPASSLITNRSSSVKTATSATSGLLSTATVNGTAIPIIVPAPTRGSTSMTVSNGTAIPIGVPTSTLRPTSFTTVNGTAVPIIVPAPTRGSTSVTLSSGIATPTGSTSSTGGSDSSTKISNTAVPIMGPTPTRGSTSVTISSGTIIAPSSTLKPSSLTTVSGTAVPIVVPAPTLGSTSTITTNGTTMPIIVPILTPESTTVTTTNGTAIPIVVPAPNSGITSIMTVSGTAIPVIVPVSTLMSTSTTTVNGTAIPIILPVPVPVPGLSKPLPSSVPKTSGATTGRSTAAPRTSSPTTAAPGSTVRTTLAPTTTESTKVSSSRPSSTSTDNLIPVPIIVDLKNEIDDDSDDTDALIVLIGAWIKSPKPNPPDILPHLDDIFPRWSNLKPKLPQPPKDDPECEHLRKRFWPFNIIGDTVKNPVQAVERIGLSLGSLRAQLMKGAIDGVADELTNLNALNDAMKKYDPFKDPCNKKSATPSSGSAATTSHSSSSSSCSARTVSNCNVVCTTTHSIKPTGANSKRQVDECSTTCGPPIVTCGASATTSISTVTSTIVAPNYCDNKCCKKLPDHTPQPMPTENAGTTPRGLHKRVLPHKDKEPWNGNMFNFMRDMCNTHSIVEEMESKDLDNKPTTSAQYVLGPDPFNVCFPGLYGCTMVIVLSHYYLWMAHFIELRSAMKPENWDEYVFKPIEFGEHGSNIPADQSLKELGKVGGAFAPDTNPVAIIIGPFERRDDPNLNIPQSTNWLYPEYSAKIEQTILRAIPHALIQYAPYVANAAQFWGFDNVSNEEKFVDEDYPYKTPYGKVLVTYDPNKYGAKKGDGCKTFPAYEIWVGDAAFSWAHDEWPALPLQVPEGWQKRQEAALGACPLPQSVIPTFSTAFRPSQSANRPSSAARSRGTTSASSAGSISKSASSTGSSTVGSTSTKPESSTESAPSTSSISPTATVPFNTPIPKPTKTVPFNTPIPAKPTSSALPSITLIQCGDKDCDCCGNYSEECKRLWCPALGKSGKDCEDYCFSEQCHGDSPSECKPDARCHRPTCPDKKGDPPKKIGNPDPIVAKQCTDPGDCGCCKDWFDQCMRNWIPWGFTQTKAYTFCVSEMCYNEQAPSQCRNNPGGCLLYKMFCPDKKGDKPKGPAPRGGPSLS